MKRIKKIEAYYKENMDKDLPDYRLLGWESEEAQALRFGALAENVPLNGLKLLEVGCGVGNFLEYLNKKGVEARYTGTDILHDMISRARGKRLKGEFYCVDIFKNNPFKPEEFDVVYSSGIFNLDLGNNMEFLSEAVTAFLGLSRRIVAFNLLSNSSPDMEERYYYYDSKEVGNLLKNKFSGKIRTVRIIEGYLQNDFTVICTKR